MLALISLREMEADGVTDAARRRELLSAMEVRHAVVAGHCGALGSMVVHGKACTRLAWQVTCSLCLGSGQNGKRQRRGTRCGITPALNLKIAPLFAPWFQTHLAKLTAYGEEHMLVKKARQLHEDANRQGSS